MVKGLKQHRFIEVFGNIQIAYLQFVDNIIGVESSAIFVLIYYNKYDYNKIVVFF